MILRSLSRTELQENSRPAATGQLFRSRYRGNDATERITRLTEALRRSGVSIPRTLLAGPEEICWIG
jgi:hypothetical protein